MSVYLDVPYCTQLRFPNACSEDNDPTGCWYASACMIGWYFEVGPRQGVPELHSSRLPAEVRARLGFTGHFATGSADAQYMMQTYGGGQSEHDLLANREHLTSVRHCEEATYNYTFAEIEALLRRFGPIFFYWQKTHDLRPRLRADRHRGDEPRTDLPRSGGRAAFAHDAGGLERQAAALALRADAPAGHAASDPSPPLIPLRLTPRAALPKVRAMWGGWPWPAGSQAGAR
jgi:hypothetical protein